MKKHVYQFGPGGADGDGKMKDVLGGKGAGLAEMCRANLPVPPGFTISTEVCNIYFENKNQVPDEIHKEMLAALDTLQKQMGQTLGDTENPLLVSVRSGAKFSMPGMMDTVLNLGLNDKTVLALERKSGNPRFAYDCYRRFIQMFGNVVLDIEKHDFDHVFDGRKKKVKARFDTDLTAEDLKAVIVDYKKLVEKKTGKPFPQEAIQQLAMSRDAVFRSWFNARAIHYRKMNNIPDNLGTAVNVQAMVFGNMGDTSATGVGFTRNPSTGEKAFYGEYLVNAQGEDVVSGVRTPQPIATLEALMPAAYRELHQITTSLEQHYRDVQDFEFTIQDGKLYMLQTRNGKRTGPAAVRIAVDMVNEGLITKEEAVLRVDPQQLDQLLHPVLDPASKKSLATIAKGLPASPGAAVGRVVFTADEAVKQATAGPVILVRAETEPNDIHGMEVAKGILTSRGGMTSHAAVVCRGMGTPCVAGAGDVDVNAQRKEMSVSVGGKKMTLKEGDWLSLDGSTGEAFAGQANTIDADPSSGIMATFMGWADVFRGGIAAVERGRNSTVPFFGPIHEVPPGHVAQRAVGLLVRGEEPEHRAHAWQHVRDKCGVVLVHPVIVQHADPPEGKRRDILLQAGGRAAVSGAFRAARGIQQLDGVAHEAAIAGHIKRDQRLHARVAGILQLLVVGAIHVGFVSAQTRGAPAGVEDLLNLGGAAVEARFALERIAGVEAVEVVDSQRLFLRFYREPEIAPGAPPKRFKASPLRAIGDEGVVPADELLALDFVAVALIVEAGEPQRLRITHVDPGVLAAAHSQLRITGGQISLVEQKRGLGVGRDFMGGLAGPQLRYRLRR